VSKKFLKFSFLKQFKMKRHFILLYISLLFIFHNLQANPGAGVTLTGKITDKQTGEAIIGAVIYLPELKSGASSGIDGTYELKNLPQSKVSVQVSYVGYQTILETVDLAVTTHKDFAIETSIIENPVVITGTSHSTEIKRNPVPIVSIDKNYLQHNLSTNAIDAISKLPGVSAVTTGPNVSKPFIRGLGYNRILTLYDGTRQEGQQWGDEHGIEVDEFAIDRIEVVKGPASLTYGSDALAGVVNLIPAQPVPAGTIKSSFSGEYQSNNGMFGGSIGVDGNKNGLVWGLRISNKSATNYRNRIDGRVYGTAFNEKDGSGYIGLNRQWGYSHLSFSVFDDLQEIPDGSRDSLTRKFTQQISEEDTLRSIVSDDELSSYKITTLHQHVQHYKINWANNFFIGNAKLAVNLGYQQNIRREFNHPVLADIPGLYLQLQSYTYDVKFNFPEVKGWETEVGLNGMYQQNKNKGTEFIIPDYNLFDAGAFAFAKKTFGKLDISGGARMDVRSFKNSEMYVGTNSENGFDMQVTIPDTAGATLLFQKYSHTFSGASGSIGATYNFSNNFLVKANIARGYRAPNISEISANGVHPGTNIYQIGNPDFKPEFSLQEDAGIFFSASHISGSVELFNNTISNYIFNQKMLNHLGQDSVIVAGNETFKYQQSNAQLYGGEISFDIHPHPLDWLHFENSISVVYGINKGSENDSEKYLPFIPPLHTYSDLRADIPKKMKHFSNMYVKAGVEYYAKQDKIFSAYNTETVTPGYTLLDAGFGTDVINKTGKTLFTINILANNITDVAYQSHLNRMKYFEDYPGNGSGHNGIYNMGRNISVKLLIPLDGKTK
jgi:iron complex outermembrane receptor protein